MRDEKVIGLLNPLALFDILFDMFYSLPSLIFTVAYNRKEFIPAL